MILTASNHLVVHILSTLDLFVETPLENITLLDEKTDENRLWFANGLPLVGPPWEPSRSRLLTLTMSCSLTPEILDLITDQLHDEPTTLKTCCLVSKSWIPRTRRHLFANVEFDDLEHTFESWMEIFPDPSNSPAYHTRSLSICDSPVASPTGTDVGGWIRAFHNVVHLNFDRCDGAGSSVSLAPFFGFSPALRSFCMAYASSEVFDLVCSFPLLEDLALVDFCPGNDTVERSARSTSPKFSGSLDLSAGARGGICSAARQLLNFPDGLRFADISILCISEDFGSVTDLVSGCSSTLESLSIASFDNGAFSSTSLIGQYLTALADVDTPKGYFPDLSHATKLRDLMLLGRRSNIRWIVEAIQTAQPNNLQQITIHPSTLPHGDPGEMDHRDWKDLDRLLVQFWTSDSVRSRLVYSPNSGGEDTRDSVPTLLPELTRRGLVDLVEYSYPPLC